MKRFRKPHRLLAIITTGLAALALSGCFNPFSPEVLTKRVTTLAPSPTSPQDAVKLFEWCWVFRGVEEYKELFTDDYVFASAALDSAGNGGRDPITRRSDELLTAENMFIGSAERPPASKISLHFDGNLKPFPDPRVGKRDSTRFYQTIRTSVDLKVDVDDGNSLEVTGYALFYLVRGDVALIPTELSARFKPDSLRWWIGRWEDETLPPSSGVVADRGRAGARPAASRIIFPMSMAEVRRYFHAN